MTGTGYLVLDTCAVHFSTAKACLQLLKYCRSVRREKYSACFQDWRPLLLEAYAKKVLSTQPHAAKSEEALKTCRAFVRVLQATTTRKTVASWTVTCRRVSVQTFPVHIMLLHGKVRNDATLFEKYPHIPLSQQSDKRRTRVYRRNVKAFLAVDKSFQGTTVRKPNIPNPDFFLRLFLLEKLVSRTF